MLQTSIDDHLARQDGVVCRAQVLECEGTDSDIARMLRRREWACVFVGVYVNHTGPLTWKQRAWAAVLYHQPAALAGVSALRATGLDVGTESSPMELVVAWPRRVVDPPGVVTRQLVAYEGAVHVNLSPPRMRVEQSALLVASRAHTEDAAVAALAAQDDSPATARGARRPAKTQASSAAASRALGRGRRHELGFGAAILPQRRAGARASGGTTPAS
jgi:hypothetical protein